MPSVLQPWVEDLTLMQQSVLLGAIRGPDGIAKYSAAKYLLRWYRRCILISAFDRVALTTPSDQRGGSFTGPSTSSDADTGDWWVKMEPHIEEYLRQFDSYPSHYTKHFMMACEIVGYKHPDEGIRNWWHQLYIRLVKDLHLKPETHEELDYRLGDNREQWSGLSEKATSV